jgi:hypothetical protein
MRPFLIQTCTMLGSDGRSHIVQAWQVYRFFVDRPLPDDDPDAWVPAGHRSWITEEGEMVDCENEDAGLFRIRGTDVVLSNPSAESPS